MIQQPSEPLILHKNANPRSKSNIPLLYWPSKAEILISNFFRKMMTTLNIICLIQPFFISNCKDANEKKSKPSHGVVTPTSSQRLPSSFQKRILKGMIIYMIISSLANNSAVSASSLPKEIPLTPKSVTSYHEDVNFFLTQANPPSFPMTSDIRTLEIGKVLKALRLNPDSIILSHDSKLAFITLKFSGAIRVIDISDHQNPIIIGSLDNLKRLEFYMSYRFKKLALSADDKTLFASSIEYLEIIDVSDPQIPTFKGILKDPKFSDLKEKDVPEYCIPTMALSSDEKILYVAGNGLQIINVTNTSRSEILYSTRMPGRKTSLALFPDSKTLLYANETLDFYDVSDPTKPELKRSYTDKNISITSVILSKNAKKVYTTGRVSNDMVTDMVILQEIDISQPDSPKYLSRYELAVSEYVPPSIIALSPSETNLFLILQSKFIPKYPLPMGVYPPIEVFGIDLLKKELMLVQSKNLFAKTTSFLMIPGSQSVISNSNDQLQIIQLFKDYPNTKTFCLANNSRTDFAFPSPVSFVEPSVDGNILFTLDSENNFKSFNFTNKNSEPKSLRNLKLTIPQNFEVQKLVITKQVALLQGGGSIYGVNISDPSKPSFLGLITQDPLMGSFVFSQKEALLFTLRPDNDIITTTMVDFSDISSIKEKSILSFPSDHLQNMACLSRNGNLLFVFSQKFSIYDASNPLSPTLLSSKEIPFFKDKSLLPMTLSADEKTLFVLNQDSNNYDNIAILDVSDTENVNLISTLELPKITPGAFFNPFIISRDMKRGFLVTEESLLVIDFKNLTSPVIVGMIPSGIFSGQTISSFFLSPDEKIGYLADNEGHLEQLNLEMPYTLFLSQEKFLLGKKYSDSLMFLSSQNTLSDFLLMDPLSEYKINKILLYDSQIISTETSPVVSYSSLPPWIHFDHENQVLSVECKDQSDLGKYTLYSLASRKVSPYVFDNIPHGSIISEDMVTLLISLGYLDTQWFLTPAFGSSETFLLPSQYWDYERMIYQTLLSYRIETFTDFEILSSLKLSTNSDGHFLITSPSNYAVKVGIKLHNSEVKFLQKIYGTLQPVITEQKSRLIIEGPLDLINQALKDLVIDQNTNISFAGEITINDKINPSITQTYQDISSYFSKNEAPGLNISHRFTLQEQIDQNTFFTGQSFSIQINPNTFFDNHTEILAYELVKTSSNGEEDLSLPPSWIILQDDLTLKGTPPEDFFHREVHLVLILKDGKFLL